MVTSLTDFTKHTGQIEVVEYHIVPFLHSIFRSEVSPIIPSWTSVPIKLGGMVIPKPKDMANLYYITSACQCTHLIQAFLSKSDLDLVFHRQTILAVSKGHQACKSTLASTILNQIGHDKWDTPHFKRHVDCL